MTVQNFFNTENARKIYDDLWHTDQIYELTGKLIHTAARNGLGYFEAKEVAEDILEGVRFCQATTQIFRLDTERCLEDFIRSLEFSPRSETTVNMLYIGFKLMDDPEFKANLKENPEEALAHCHSADFSASPKEKLEFVCQTLRTFNYTGEKLRTITRDLLYTNTPMETAIKYARENLSRNAIAALELYLQNPTELTPKMAAVIACTFRESRDLNEAIQAGREHQKFIVDEIEGIYILALIIAAISLIYLALHGQFLAGAIAAGIMAGLYGIPFILRKPVGNLLGRLQVEYAPGEYMPVKHALPDTAPC